MRWLSLEGKVTGLLLTIGAAGAALGVWLARTLDSALLVAVLSALLLLPLILWLARIAVRPMAELMRALSGAVASFRDGDFSFSVHTRRRDEVGDLVAAHNELGAVLREERQNLFQRELLLHTVVQNTPTALMLVDAHDHIVYANTAARQLLNGGRKLEGHSFAQVCAESPTAMRDAVARGQDAIFSVSLDGEDEAFHLATRGFQLNGQAHRLLLIRRMTRELSRQEVSTWKKVIRVISHELNNSLAPISSLAHSGAELVERGEHGALSRVFTTIEERARHLDGFIRGYAAFAKLPNPRPAAVDWAPFLARLAESHAFRSTGSVPARPGWFDQAQLAQALINLLKNAHEAGGASEGVEIEVQEIGREFRIDVRDRGAGMSEQVMANALVPFYSTKRSGTGLGLALTREIAEAHGGRVALSNRQGGGLEVSLLLPVDATF
jgi:nitrogen fixation/metabolism regulation signal transduction histidine kinase